MDAVYLEKTAPKDTGSKADQVSARPLSMELFDALF